MRAPTFWDKPGLIPTLLSPLAWIGARITAGRVAKPPKISANIPVICVGNINAGGTGKTPTAIALVELLSSHGLKPAILSRGHGGSAEGPLKVDPNAHTAEETGDEPLLLANFAPTWISKDRAAGARAALAENPDVLILDDGFQNPAIRKTASIVVVDARKGFGNGRVMPAGPLREPVSEGMKRADICVVIGAPDDQQSFANRWAKDIPVPILGARIQPLPTGMPWQGMKVFAFAGIGVPEKFFRTLKDLGADVRGTVALADHQPITDALFTRLKADADRAGAKLVTTDKDAVRLPKSQRLSVLPLPVRLVFDDPEALKSHLTRLGALPKSP